jgi:CDP-paratose 2-epimerase
LEFDVCIEASAEPSVMAGLNSSRRYLIDTNLVGLVNALDACAKNSAKLIFLSSSRIYPMNPINSLDYEECETRYKLTSQEEYITNGGFNEEFPIKGARTLYGATKLAAELLIEEYCEMFGLQAIVNRCGVLAGAWQFGKVDQGFMTLWCASHFYKNPLTIFGNGKQVRDVLNVTDLYELINLQIGNFDKFDRGTFNVGGGLSNSVSLLELEKITSEVIGANELSFAQTRGLDIKYYVSDNTKINTLCGWSPKKSVADTVREISEWINANSKELKPILG